MKGLSLTQQIHQFHEAKELPTSLLILVRAPKERRRFHDMNAAGPRNEIRVQRLMEALLAGPTGDRPIPAIKRLNLAEASIGEITSLLEQARNLSLFDPVRIFALLNAENLKESASTQVVDHLSKLPRGVTVFIVARNLDPSDPVLKYCKQSHSCLELEPLSDEGLRKWLLREWHRAGITECSESLIDATIQIAGNDLDLAVQVIEQGALYSEGTTISDAELLELFPHQTQPDDYRLAELLAAGALPESETLIHELLARERSAFALLGLLNRSYLTYFSLLLSSKEETAKAFKTSPKMLWLLDKDLRAASRFTLPGVVKALKAILRADGHLKNRNLGEEEVLARCARSLVAHR